MLRQQQVVRGNTHHGRDAAVGDELQHPPGIERSLENHRGPHPPGQQRLHVPAAHVVLGHDSEHRIGTGDLGGPGQRQVGPEAVGVGENRALGAVQCARREHDEQGIVILDGTADAARPASLHGCNHLALDAAHAEAPRRRAGHEQFERGGGQRVELVLDQEQGRVGLFELLGQLPRGEPPRQGNEHESGLRAREEQHHVIRAVTGERGDAVADPVARIDERVGQAGGTILELPVGEHNTSIVDRDALGCGEGTIHRPAAQGVQTVRCHEAPIPETGFRFD